MKRKLKYKHIILAFILINIVLLLTMPLMQPDWLMYMGEMGGPNLVLSFFTLRRFLINCLLLLAAVMLWLFIGLTLEEHGVIEASDRDVEDSGTAARPLWKKILSKLF